MSISATKFTASRSRRVASSKKMLGWGLLFVVVTGFSWWALTGRGSVAAPSTPETADGNGAMSSEERAQLAAADAFLPKTAPSTTERVPTGTPVVSAPAPRPEPAASLTMGAPVTKSGTVSAPPGVPLANVAASNTPGSNPAALANPATNPPVNQSTNAPTSPARDAGASPSTSQPSAPSQSAPSQPQFTQSPAAAPGGGGTGGGGSVSSSSAVAFLVTQGDAMIAQGKPVDGRDAYNRALFDPRATESDRSVLRDKLAALADAITFSPRIEPGDAMVEQYTFQSGDRLVKLPYTKNLAVDWRLITRVNRIADPGKIGLNQRMKLIKGPFHAIVNKGAFRMDIYSSVKDSAGNQIYVKSFAVGLGEHGSTPTGSFIVKPKSKLVNPKWVNPRTGEKFGADDPKNPIGERWLGLDGTDANTKLLSGYGIHGTVEPESIGTEKSMGCVRLVDRDVEFVYELLFEGASTVEIRP
jgi:cytoskeletal protein RodZ